MASPKIIFNYNFIMAMKNPDRKKLNRDKTVKVAQGLFDYYNKDMKTAENIFDYYSGEINKNERMNIMLENGEYATENQIEYRKRKYSKYIENSNLARCVISFNNDYINKKIDIEKLEKIIVTKVLPMYFKKCGYKDSKKMSYQISLHTDTDNLHFHFSYIEKEPNYIYDKNKVGYKRVGMIKEDEINFLKNQILHEIEKETIYTPLLKETNNVVDELKKYFKSGNREFVLRDFEDLILEANILQLGYMIHRERRNKEGKIKYGSIGNIEIERMTQNIKEYLFSKKNPEFQKEVEKFRKCLDDINLYFEKISKDNNIETEKIDTTLIESKQKYLDNYIFNAIVNHANYVYKNKLNNVITENEIIQEIVYKNYDKNIKKSQFEIITNNFLKNKNKRSYINKNKLEQSIKNINREMDEAQKEFSKLFDNQYYEV